MNMNEELDIEFLLKQPLSALVSYANAITIDTVGCDIELCSIMNAKSGLCSEDCTFCAQSASHCCDIATYPLRTKEQIVAAAGDAKEIGANRFGIVTSGNALTSEELETIAHAISEITSQVGIAVCCSLGALSSSQLLMLRDAGLCRYHHNIETSERFYGQIVSTHEFKERTATITAAKEVGLEVCSGGIIGMGESWQDRIDMALLLKELDVDSVPVNLLVPIAGTQLELIEPISCVDAIRTICIFRIILKNKPIKIAAGRESVLKDFQALAFLAGASGMLIGGYLTVKGRKVSEDKQLVKELKQIRM